MTTLLTPPTNPASRVSGPSTTRATELQTIARAVDHSMHATALLVRAGVYGVLVAVIGSASFGPSFLFGALLGDLLGSIAQLRNTLRQAPIAAVTESLMLIGFVSVGVASVGWPVDAEMRALLLLSAFAAFAAFAARLGWAFGDRNDRDL